MSVAGGSETPQPPSRETGGSSDSNSVPGSQSQAGTAVGTGTLQAGSLLAFKGAMSAARTGGCWNLLPLSDPEESSFGAGLLGTLH